MKEKRNIQKNPNNIVYILGITLILFIITFIIICSNFMGIKDKIYNVFYKSRVSELTNDNVEIEKKWLIDKDNIKYDLSEAKVYEIEQTYINFSPEIRVRKINAGQQYTFAVKTNITEDGMTRNELEENITEEEYKSMITKKEGNTIYKTRYQFLDGDYLLAIDIFSGDLDGLAYLEIEFENHEIANNYETPDWIIKDVTSDLNYKNGHLARYGIPESYYEYMK
jgi:CYTH domain-containing protein